MARNETPCPNALLCGGTITFAQDWGEDGDPTTPYYRAYTFAYIAGQTCTCDLADAQREALETEATRRLDDEPAADAWDMRRRECV